MMGFLSSTQEGQSKTRMALWMGGLPTKGCLGYLWDWLLEIGLGKEIDWSEISAWSAMANITPLREESILLIQLSREWLSERMRGTDKHALPCWDQGVNNG